ncbi:hypothetical protein B6N13_02180 [Marinomonas sp. UCMA 3892]|uniref:hypothetical protein n=1 Tax=Marinomonas sp. UCMA 3892 TaxID=1972585 RepID=UPI00146D9389|nr:hypothetical protein [Marinomonas sp. UCMA 3892]NLU96906.1 hypothetical protein [Marinomonas sp. UCMA 3892]
MVSGKLYLKVVAFFIILFFFVIAIVNYIVDPYWQFDFASSNTITGVNDQISEYYLMGHVYPDLMLDRQKKIIQNSLANIVIIGTSRSLKGLNTCDNYNIQKVGFSGISQRFSMQLFEKTISSNSKKYVFFELGSLLNDKELPSEKLTALEALFSIRIFFNSLSNFYESYTNQKKYPFCNISTVQLRKWSKERVEKQRTLYQNSLSSIEPIMERIAQQCEGSLRDENNPLNIILYIDPVNPNLMSYDKLLTMKKTLEKIIVNHDFGGGCSLKVEIFQESKEISQETNWYDINHYNPLIGDYFLKEMLRNNVILRSK